MSISLFWNGAKSSLFVQIANEDVKSTALKLNELVNTNELVCEISGFYRAITVECSFCTLHLISQFSIHVSMFCYLYSIVLEFFTRTKIL